MRDETTKPDELDELDKALALAEEDRAHAKVYGQWLGVTTAAALVFGAADSVLQQVTTGDGIVATAGVSLVAAVVISTKRRVKQRRANQRVPKHAAGKVTPLPNVATGRAAHGQEGVAA